MSTRAVHRRALAPLLGVAEQGTADASADSTTAQLACTTALVSGARFKTTVLPASYFRGKWLYRPVAVLGDDRDRLIASYTPEDGFLSPDQAWTNDPGGEVFEITSLFSGADLNTLVNEGLKQCLVVVEFTVTVISNQTTRHSLAVAAPWLVDPRWVLKVGQLLTGTDRLVSDPYGSRSGEAVKVGAAVYLQGLSFNTTDTIYITALKPAYDHCKSTAGAYGDQAGLALETDEAPVDPTWVAWAAILAAADRLAHLEGTAEGAAEALRSRQMAAARFSTLTRENLTIPERTFFPRRTYIGASLSGGRGRRW